MIPFRVINHFLKTKCRICLQKNVLNDRNLHKNSQITVLSLNRPPVFQSWNLFQQKNRYLLEAFNRSVLVCGNSLLQQRSLHTSSVRYSNFDKDKDNNDKFFNNTPIYILLLLLSVVGLFSLYSEIFDEPLPHSVISWNEFAHQMLAAGEVHKVIIMSDKNFVVICLHPGAVLKGRQTAEYTYCMRVLNHKHFESRLRQFEDSLGIRPDQRIPIVYDHSSGNSFHTIYSVLFTIFLLMVFRWLFRNSSNIRMPGLPSQKAKFTIIDPLIPNSGRGVKFSDVAGSHEAKQEVMEFVDFLKNPSKYQTLGAKVPRGALLLGPPGCGKTLLAKAVATEGNVPFLAMNGSEFVELVAGIGAGRVRSLFKEAKKRSPCIIYIDELDAIGRQRSAGNSGFSSQEEEQTLNQLLVEMDGLLTKEGVLLLSSTNRLDILDKALLRPGRFDRHIIMDLPTLEERREIFEHHLKNIILENPSSTYAKRMAALTLGFTGADIANVVNEAALYAARNAKKVVCGGDLEYAVEKVVGGTEKQTQVLGPEEKRVVAYHESGHALIGWLLQHTDTLLKVTIVPRTNHALGFAQYTPKDQKLYTQEEIFEKMCMALGGRVAESLIFNRVTTGAQDDLDKVTKIAYAQVKSFGFSKEVGQVSFPDEDGRDIGRRPYSQHLTAKIEDEVNKMIFKAYKKTEDVLSANKEKLKLLAETLLKKETLNYKDVEAILGPPPFEKQNPIEPSQFENEIRNWKKAGETEDL